MNPLVVEDFRFISAFCMRNEPCIYQLSFPELDVNVFQAILTIQRFSVWPDAEKLS